MNTNDILSNFAKLLNNVNVKLSLETAFNNMIDYLSVRCRPETINYNKKVYKGIKEWFYNNGYQFIEDITKPILNSFISDLKSKGLKNTSINKYIEVIKHIAKYNYDNELSSANHISNFKKLKYDTAETKTIDNKTISKVFTYLETLDKSNTVILRNIISIYLMHDTGARLNELLHIEIKNINLKNNVILLTFTKTGRTRKVYFSNHTKDLLQEYLTRKELKDCIYLLSNFDTKEIIFKTIIYQFIDDITKKLDLDCSISPHKWRHTLATNLINENVNVSIVQKVLGHCNLEITQRYIHENDKIIQSSVLDILK